MFDKIDHDLVLQANHVSSRKRFNGRQYPLKQYNGNANSSKPS